MKNNKITFMLQGPVDRYNNRPFEKSILLRNISNIRKLFDGSQIILSTWDGSNVTGIECDKIIFSIDPGSLSSVFHGVKIVSNINRQIVSTIAGLREVRTEYVVKMRTDSIISSNMMLKIYNDGKILIPRMFCINPRTYMKNPYNFSDIFMFGPTARIASVWDVPLATQEYMEYFLRRKKPTFIRSAHVSKYSSEQYIWVHAAKSSCKHSLDTRYVRESEKYICENLLIVDEKDIGLSTPSVEEKFRGNELVACLYTKRELASLYKTGRVDIDFLALMVRSWFLGIRIAKEIIKRIAGPLCRKRQNEKFARRGD